MGCGTNFVKYCLFFFNIVIAIIALGMIVVGVGFLVQWELTKDIQLTSLNGTDWALIGLGLATLATAFFGCYSFIRGSYGGVVMYTTVMLVIIVAEVAIGVVLFSYDASNEEYIVSVNEMFKRRNDGDSGANFIIENLQEHVKCCGAEGPQDYLTLGLPPSCCALDVQDGCIVDKAYPGCIPTLTRLSKNWSVRSTAAVVLGIACLEVIGIIFAICHANSLRNEARRSRY